MLKLQKLYTSKIPFQKVLNMLKIANIISWNIWQMDGLKFTVPYSSINAIRINQQLSLFQEEIHEAGYCVIKDWKAVRLNKKSIIEYRSLIDKEE